MIDDDALDGCSLDFKEEEQTADDAVEVMPLFADALDPNTPSTLEEAVEFWRRYAVPNGDS